MWEIARKDPRRWNAFSMVLKCCNKYVTQDIMVTLPLQEWRTAVSKEKWSDVMNLITVEYRELLELPTNPTKGISNEKELVDIYNAVDLFVTPSLEENLPNTIMEAMACGTPCIGFEVGGIPEMIDHLHNGYVAEYKSSEDFANGIHWALSEGEYQSLSDEARRKVVSSYSENAIAQKHIEVYNKITGDYD